MTKVYAGPRSTFLLTAPDGSTMLVHPNTFAEIPDKFTGDITFRSAVASGDLKPFKTVKQGDEAERKANAPKGKKTEPSNEAGAEGGDKQ